MNEIIGEAVRVIRFMTEVLEQSSMRIKTLKASAPGCDPNISMLVFGKRAGRVGAQTGRVAGVVSV